MERALLNAGGLQGNTKDLPGDAREGHTKFQCTDSESPVLIDVAGDVDPIVPCIIN